MLYLGLNAKFVQNLLVLIREHPKATAVTVGIAGTINSKMK